MDGLVQSVEGLTAFRKAALPTNKKEFFLLDGLQTGT